MHTHTIFTVLVAVALSTAAASAAPEITLGISESAALATKPHPLADVKLSLGASRTEVVYALRQPSFKLSPGGWVYQKIQANRAGSAVLPYAALVVVFNDRGVISYRLVSDNLLATLIDDPRHVPREPVPTLAQAAAAR